MFDRAQPGSNLLNTDCRIYAAIAEIAAVLRHTAPLRFGRMYYRQISDDSVHFGFPFGNNYTLAFSRLLYGAEVLIAYDVSSQARSDSVVVDASPHGVGSTMSFLYGGRVTWRFKLRRMARALFSSI